MTIDFYSFEKAVRQGNWLIIPASFLFINLYAAIWIVIPYFLHPLLESPIPSQIDNESPNELTTNWWSVFQYGAVILCRLGIIIGLMLSFLRRFIPLQILRIGRIGEGGF